MFSILNQAVERFMPILTPLSLVVGILLGARISEYVILVPFIFAFMTFSSSLSLNFKSLGSFLKHPLFVITVLLYIHVLMPLIAIGGSKLFFDDAHIQLGFILAMAIPTGVTSFIWITMCKGEASLGLTIILIDTLLSPIIVPFTLHLFAGETIHIDNIGLMLDLLWMIVLPSVIGMILNEVTKGRIKEVWGPKLAPFSKMSIFFVVMLNGSVTTPLFYDFTPKLIGIIVAVFVMAVLGYVVAMILGKYMFKRYDLMTTFTFSGGMRNISVGAVIASTYFSSSVVLPVVAGMLFQQVLASVFSKIVKKGAA